ncbi:AraC family transcriptional regulator [Vibrio sp. CAU 1672]|uniref:helix-turn-helix domain-containing protein n=1 Tax=Vibrio sp. CAU 1672 TaxID=3032594 RepID=UPI0023DC0C2B|nr:AraC family transcriptional regulator [Vibrio sp. CAU 1672]MDF2154437.1 AraC family transcriptional regulator [Vibrio sp. CAU 1672]
MNKKQTEQWMKSRICWLGKPTKALPQVCLKQLNQHFHVVEYGDDISIISDPGVHYFFLYLGNNSPLPIKCISTLCNNLNKQLIIISDKGEEVTLPDRAITSEVYQLDSASFAPWLLHLQRKYFLHPTESLHPIVISPSEPSANTDLNKVLDFVEHNLQREIREEDVAAICHYSATYFSKYFRKQMGVCFRDYLIEKRLTLAKSLLLSQPSLKIAYIAYQCGYQDISYFARIFKKRTGLSPASYRQQYFKETNTTSADPAHLLP